MPWLHIAEVVARRALEMNLKQPGVLETKFLMERPVYKEASPLPFS